MIEPNRLMSVVQEGTSFASKISLAERWPSRARRSARRSSASLSESALRRSAMISCALANVLGGTMGSNAFSRRIHISDGFLITFCFSLNDSRLKTMLPM